MCLNENIVKLLDIDRKNCHFWLLTKKESFILIEILELLPIHPIYSDTIFIDLKEDIIQNLSFSLHKCSIFHYELSESNIFILIIIAIVLKQSSEHVLNTLKYTVLRYVTECNLMKWKIFNLFVSLSAKS